MNGLEERLRLNPEHPILMILIGFFEPFKGGIQSFWFLSSVVFNLRLSLDSFALLLLSGKMRSHYHICSCFNCGPEGVEKTLSELSIREMTGQVVMKWTSQLLIKAKLNVYFNDIYFALESVMLIQISDKY